MNQYQIQFAPDGEHWQKIKTNTVEKLWDDFCFNPEYRRFVEFNPEGKVQLISLATGQIIGTICGHGVFLVPIQNT